MGTVQQRKIRLCLQTQFDRLAADLISHSPSSPRFMIGLGVPVLAEYQTDKSTTTKTAPATINQCGYCISESMLT
jgi:hypothetical protein